MTLDPGLLRQGLSPLFRPETMPRSVSAAVLSWAQAYATYAQPGIAGPCSHSPLSPVAGTGPFYQALDEVFRTMWTAVAWVGPGFTGVTAVVPSLVAVLEANRERILQCRDRELALSIVTEAIHTYTLGVTVTVVPTSGPPSILPLT